jgi:hypothetical protein
MSDSMPWAKISRPNVGSMYTALRVDPLNPFDFFWGIDLESRRLLILRYKFLKSVEIQLPKLKEIEIVISPDEDGSMYLIWALDDKSHESIFYELCLDITKAASLCKSVEEAVKICLNRTKQWQRMMRSTSVLSRELQMGLIGELLVLDRFLLGYMPAEKALHSWVGPFGAPRDFDLGSLKIESKTRSSGTPHEIKISSELQLELSGSAALVLHVIELEESSGHPRSYSVKELVQQIRSRFIATDSVSLELFDERIDAVGLLMTDDYSAQKWIDYETELFQVTDMFPKLVPKEIPNPISKVRYSIDLDFCKEFSIDEVTLRDFVEKS